VNKKWKMAMTDEWFWKQRTLEFYEATEDDLRTKNTMQQFISSGETNWRDYFRKNAQTKNLPYLIIGFENNGKILDDIKFQLEKVGFKNITVLDGQKSIIECSMLLNYKGILVFTNMAPDLEMLGNKMTEYLESKSKFEHKGVVLAAYSNYSGFTLTGNWTKYTPWYPSSECIIHVRSTLGSFIHNHPILKNVSKFDGGIRSTRIVVQLHKTTKVIANWADKVPLIVERQVEEHKVIGLNFYPISNQVDNDGWEKTTDGAVVIGNALSYVASSYRFDFDSLPSVLLE